MNATATRPLLTVLTSATLLLAACGGSETSNESADAVTASDGTSDDTSADNPVDDGDGLDDSDVGTGNLRIDGVEHPDFTGDCEITRNFGSDDVGDVSVGGLSVIVAIDNVDAGDPDTLDDDLNFIMIGEEGFRIRTVDRGTIDSITEVGSRTSSGSRDFATIVFAGTVDDGRQVEAEVVCELQNQF